MYIVNDVKFETILHRLQKTITSMNGQLRPRWLRYACMWLKLHNRFVKQQAARYVVKCIYQIYANASPKRVKTDSRTTTENKNLRMKTSSVKTGILICED